MIVDKYPPNPKGVQVRLPCYRDGNFELKFTFKEDKSGSGSALFDFTLEDNALKQINNEQLKNFNAAKTA